MSIMPSNVAEELSKKKETKTMQDVRIGWCREDTELLIKMTEAGETDDEIAATLGRTKRAVRSKRNKLNKKLDAPISHGGKLMGGTVWTDDEIATLIEMVTAGATDKAIGDALGRTARSVMGKRARLNETLDEPIMRPVVIPDIEDDDRIPKGQCQRKDCGRRAVKTKSMSTFGLCRGHFEKFFQKIPESEIVK